MDHAKLDEALRRADAMGKGPDLLWWVPDEEKAIAIMEKAIAGKPDHAEVRMPWGDARPEKVSVHKARIAVKRRGIEEAKRLAKEGKMLPL